MLELLNYEWLRGSTLKSLPLNRLAFSAIRGQVAIGVGTLGGNHINPNTLLDNTAVGRFSVR